MTVSALPVNSAQKVCAILRALSSHAPMRLTEIAVASTLNKATAFRILEILCQEGFVRRIPHSMLYELGNESLAMAMAGRASRDVVQLARPSLVKLAVEAGDNVLLGVHSGIEVVYVDREVGSFPIQANYLHVGSRRPLGVGAGGMALLACLPDREVEVVLDLIEPRLERYPEIPLSFIRQEISRTRERGAAVMLDRIVKNMGGIAVPILSAQREVLGAFSLVGLSERLRERQSTLVDALQREAAQVARAVNESAHEPTRLRAGGRQAQ